MKRDGVEMIRTLETKEQRDGFNNKKDEEEGEESKKVPAQDIELDSDNDKSSKPRFVCLPFPSVRFLKEHEAWLKHFEEIRRLKREIRVGDREDVGEWFNKLSVEDKQRYICRVPNLHNEVGDGRVFCIGETSGTSTKNMKYGRGETSRSSTKNMKYGCGETSGLSTENMNYGRGEVRGHSDRNHTHKNHSASDDEGNYEGLTEATQKSTEAGQKSYEAAMKRNIDNKKVNDEHVVDMPESPDHSNKKEQAIDGPFKLCEIGLANTVSLMGSNPPPWATTPTSQRLLGFSGAANLVGHVASTAALSLRYTKPGAARIFANIGPIGCAWGVIMGFTSYLPREFQWLGYIAALLCTLAVLLANY